LPAATAGGHPLTPFVIGDQGSGDEDDGENAEKNLHGVFRIARVGGLGLVLSMAFS
jgi:hypothetical protein